MKTFLARLDAALNKLLAQKLFVAFIVSFVASFAATIEHADGSLTTSLLWGALGGALGAGARAVLALGPFNLVPSDVLNSLFGQSPTSFAVTPAANSSGHVKVTVAPDSPIQPRHPLKFRSPVAAADSITIRRLAEVEVKGQRLGRHVEHDERSRAHGVGDTSKPVSAVVWKRHGVPFNQGDLGSCTGNALAGVLNTDPFRTARGGKLLAEADAVKLYALATTLDSIAGVYPPTDTGSSGLAVCKAAVQLGLIGGYRHAFSIAEALAALKTGPVITGVNWYKGFDTPDKHGVVEISGQVRGGHEFEVRGYDPATDLVEAENSWGKSWGLAGVFYFTSRTWAQLLAQQGDVTVPFVGSAA